MTIDDKLEALKTQLAGLGGAVVAFSGGVDSTLLLDVAHEVLGDRVLAVTEESQFSPAGEAAGAAAFCEERGIAHVPAACDVLAVEGVADNPPERCYLCKKALFSEMLRIAEEHGLTCVVDGSNLDDMGDYRPGIKALEELGIVSPLRDAGLTKADIRELSKRRGLPTWDKPSMACLASRFAYGERLVEERLQLVDDAERLLRAHGFAQVRVRMHGDIARIEVEPHEIERASSPEVREPLARLLSDGGVKYVTLDMEGFRSGSMNAALGN